MARGLLGREQAAGADRRADRREGRGEFIRQECLGEPKQSLWEKIRAKLPGGRKTDVEPAKMTCEQFVALGEETRPAVAYYLHGYTRSGTHTATQGVSAQVVALDQDVMRVVEKCRAAPHDAAKDQVEQSF